ncbi:hypothetical protein YC2023_024383 [Brassica napus]
MDEERKARIGSAVNKHKSLAGAVSWIHPPCRVPRSPRRVLRSCRRKAYPNSEAIPCDQFDVAFQAVELWIADRAVLQVENSLGGSIHRNYDLLLRHRLHIIGEVQIPVHHCLLALPRVRADCIHASELDFGRLLRKLLEDSRKTLGKILGKSSTVFYARIPRSLREVYAQGGTKE